MENPQLSCGACGAALRKEDLDHERGIATCGYCDAVFGLERLLGQGAREEDRPRPSLDVGLPAAFTRDDMGSELVLRRRWFSPGGLFLVFFMLFWNAFVIFWIIAATVAGGFFGLFGLPFLAIGVGMGYTAVAGLVNSTTIRIGSYEVQIRHGPLPWKGSRDIRADEIAQVFCKSAVTSGKHGRQLTTFETHVVRADNVREPLVTGLREPEEAWYLEQEIERTLGIADEPVTGELER